MKPAPVAPWAASASEPAAAANLNQIMMEEKLAESLAESIAAAKPAPAHTAKAPGSASKRVPPTKSAGRGAVKERQQQHQQQQHVNISKPSAKPAVERSPEQAPVSANDQDFNAVADFILEGDDEKPHDSVPFSSAGSGMFGSAPQLDNNLTAGWSQSGWSSVPGSWDGQGKPVSVNYATAFSATGDGGFGGQFNTPQLGLGFIQQQVWADAGSSFQQPTITSPALFGGSLQGSEPPAPQWSSTQLASWDISGGGGLPASSQKSSETKQLQHVASRTDQVGLQPMDSSQSTSNNKYTKQQGGAPRDNARPIRGRGGGPKVGGGHRPEVPPAVAAPAPAPQQAETNKDEQPGGGAPKPTQRPTRGTYQPRGGGKRPVGPGNNKPMATSNEGAGDVAQIKAPAVASGDNANNMSSNSNSKSSGPVARAEGAEVPAQAASAPHSASRPVRGRGGSKPYVPHHLRDKQRDGGAAPAKET
jgi:hypothetical protein